MMTMYFMKEIPFKEIFITGLIRDENGQKMSKSKGNILDPIDLIDGISLEELIRKRTFGLMQPQLEEKIITATQKQFPNGIDSYGTDALRFTFYSLAAPGRDINFDIGRISGFKNFCNKIWNAMHFIGFQIDKYGYKKDLAMDPFEHPLNIWMHEKIVESTNAITQHIENYRFDIASNELYELIWSKYCDWYIEFTKNQLSQANHLEQSALISGLIANLEDIVKLAHPFMPFITEQVFRNLKKLQSESFPDFLVDSGMPQQREIAKNNINPFLDDIIDCIASVRATRNDLNLDNKITLALNIPPSAPKRLFNSINTLKASFNKMCGIADIYSKDLDKDSKAMNILIAGEKCQLVLPENFSFDDVLSSLKNKLEKIQEKISSIKKKLANKDFISKAPKNVVTNQQEQLQELVQEKESLEESIKKYS
jgi:valyl-tRNA synthetase